MNHADRKRWAAARTLADVGAITAQWLEGELEETPSHLGPPDPETIPYIAPLAAVNRAGFVTDNSQAANEPHEAALWGPCNAYVSGFVAEADFVRLFAITGPAGLLLTSCCRGRRHSGHRWSPWWLRWALPCPRQDLDDFYAGRCPLAADEVCAAWHVTIEDPQDGRNDRLWPALTAYAAERSRESRAA